MLFVMYILGDIISLIFEGDLQNHQLIFRIKKKKKLWLFLHKSIGGCQLCNILPQNIWALIFFFENEEIGNFMKILEDF